MAIGLLSFRRRPVLELADLPGIPVAAAHVQTLAGPEAFRLRLLELIGQARTRILISVLYLQDDLAGRELLQALYDAKAARPALDIRVFVDWHRARRGLIGKTKSPGNAAFYQEMATRLGPGVPIRGLPVQTRELLGVMHLKGFVLDDQVLYSGASLNNDYLDRQGRYRLDRYHLIQSRELADSMAGLLTEVVQADPAVQPLDRHPHPGKAALGAAIARFRVRLKKASYDFAPGPATPADLRITPLIGLGRSGNALNRTLLQLIQGAQDRIVLFTPYFNLPRLLNKAIRDRLKAGCRVTIILGDKTANDFFIPPSEPFRTIAALPYLYELNLRRFCKAQQRAIDQGLLDLQLWKDGDNTFHQKGIWVDGQWTLLTGNNLNPRAWWLDLENGLLIRDPEGRLRDQHERELAGILAHTRRLASWKELESIDDYPVPVKRLLKRLTRPLIDRLVNQVL
jgi:CDP-diacylglycerol--serine O-phosphatidyltransferase